MGECVWCSARWDEIQKITIGKGRMACKRVRESNRNERGAISYESGERGKEVRYSAQRSANRDGS